MEKRDTAVLDPGGAIEVGDKSEGLFDFYLERNKGTDHEVAMAAEVIPGADDTGEVCFFTCEPVMACSVRNSSRRRCPYSVEFCGQ